MDSNTLELNRFRNVQARLSQYVSEAGTHVPEVTIDKRLLATGLLVLSLIGAMATPRGARTFQMDLLDHAIRTMVDLRGSHQEQSYDTETIGAFDILYKNAEFHNAQVILIGQTHRDMPRMNLINNFIEEHAQDGDIVLIEGEVFGEEIDTSQTYDEQTSGISRRVHILGWEDATTYGTAIEFALEQLELALSVDRARSNRYRELAIMEYEDREDQFRTDLFLRDRNISLVCALEKAARQYPGRKIFILAGAEHLFEHHLREAIKGYAHMAIRPNRERDQKAFEAANKAWIKEQQKTTPLTTETPWVSLVFRHQDGTYRSLSAGRFYDSSKLKPGDTTYITPYDYLSFTQGGYDLKRAYEITDVVEQRDFQPHHMITVKLPHNGTAEFGDSWFVTLDGKRLSDPKPGDKVRFIKANYSILKEQGISPHEEYEIIDVQ